MHTTSLSQSLSQLSTGGVTEEREHFQLWKSFLCRTTGGSGFRTTLRFSSTWPGTSIIFSRTTPCLIKMFTKLASSSVPVYGLIVTCLRLWMLKSTGLSNNSSDKISWKLHDRISDVQHGT